MKYEIKNRWSGEVIFSIETTSFKLAVEAAIKGNVNLRGSDLRDSDLSGSDLSGSDLSYSDLSGSDLSYSNLSGSNLRYSNLRYSNLRGSNLSGSDLRGSNLSGSDLRGSNLRGSNLRGSDLSYSDLSGSDLSGSNLRDIRNDLWAVLLFAKNEVNGLRQALIDGKVNGSAYEGECACLVGTIANLKKCKYDALPNLQPDSSRPIEKFFTAIKTGDTPENNPVSKLVVEWIDIWLANQEVRK